MECTVKSNVSSVIMIMIISRTNRNSFKTTPWWYPSFSCHVFCSRFLSWLGNSEGTRNVFMYYDHIYSRIKKIQSDDDRDHWRWELKVESNKSVRHALQFGGYGRKESVKRKGKRFLSFFISVTFAYIRKREQREARKKENCTQEEKRSWIYSRDFFFTF